MMLDPVRMIEHLHGHMGWLAAAALVHPAILLRNPARRAHLAVGLGTALVSVASLGGAWLYVSYTERLRQGIFATAPAFGLAFERKEHLAFGAVVLAWAGAAAYFAAPRATEATRRALRTIAFRSFVASAVLAVIVALLGTAVGVYRTF
jgi:hypothetical protein